jgi:hypothetical protein
LFCSSKGLVKTLPLLCTEFAVKALPMQRPVDVIAGVRIPIPITSRDHDEKFALWGTFDPQREPEVFFVAKRNRIPMLTWHAGRELHQPYFGGGRHYLIEIASPHFPLGTSRWVNALVSQPNIEVVKIVLADELMHHLDQMFDLLYHASGPRGIRDPSDTPDAIEPKPDQGLTLFMVTSYRTSGLLDLNKRLALVIEPACQKAEPIQATRAGNLGAGLGLPTLRGPGSGSAPEAALPMPPALTATACKSLPLSRSAPSASRGKRRASILGTFCPPKHPLEMSPHQGAARNKGNCSCCALLLLLLRDMLRTFPVDPVRNGKPPPTAHRVHNDGMIMAGSVGVILLPPL